MEELTFSLSESSSTIEIVSFLSMPCREVGDRTAVSPCSAMLHKSNCVVVREMAW